MRCWLSRVFNIKFSKKYDVRIDVLDEVTRVQVGECEGEEFYKDLVETVRNYSGKISIANGVVGSVSKEDFLRGEEIIQGLIEEINQTGLRNKKPPQYIIESEN